MKTEVVVSKYKEKFTGRDVLRIQFEGSALSEMCRIFGKKWNFTPRLSASHEFGLSIRLVNEGSDTYHSKETVEDASKKIIMIHDYHLKGETLAAISRFLPTPVSANCSSDAFVILVPPTIAFGQGELFHESNKPSIASSSNVVVKSFIPPYEGGPLKRPMTRHTAAQLKSICDLTLKFADGTKLVRAVTMAEAIEIAAKYNLVKAR